MGLVATITAVIPVLAEAVTCLQLFRGTDAGKIWEDGVVGEQE
jgi:hypothetical protein